MNALAAAPNPQPLMDTFVIALADEGIPVGAIARATRTPYSDVYDILRDALGRGALIEIPKADWPPGVSRIHRLPTLASPLQDDDQLRISCAQVFKITRLEAAVFATLLKRNTLTKQQLHQVIEQNRPSPGLPETDEKMVDVIICHLRKKLKRHELAIETIWGIGYMMALPERERAISLLNGA